MKNYIAKETKSFTVGQTMPDIIKDKIYQCDKKKEYFIGEFGDMISLSAEDFETYFKADERASHRKATSKYFKNNVKVIYLRLFPEDKDIIDHLATIKEPTRTSSARNGQSEYIRRLIREDMKKEKGE